MPAPTVVGRRTRCVRDVSRRRDYGSWKLAASERSHRRVTERERSFWFVSPLPNFFLLKKFSITHRSNCSNATCGLTVKPDGGGQSAQSHRQENLILPSDWLTFSLLATFGVPHQTYESPPPLLTSHPSLFSNANQQPYLAEEKVPTRTLSHFRPKKKKRKRIETRGRNPPVSYHNFWL